MGFFDKAKTFMTGSSMVTVEFTRIERQPAASATLPIGDSVVKGNYTIKAQKDCTILRHVAQFRTRWPEKDGPLGTMHQEDVNDENNQIMGAPYTFPYEMKAGQTMDATFLIHDLDIPAFLKKSYGLDALTPQVECFIKVIVDVKGSPFDPEFEARINVV